MIVIGGGIGGLLTAALYPNVTLFEKTSSLGGRFRNLPYKGFQLTTGALHMIPHGNKGPLARLLREVNAPCPIIDSHPKATFHYEKEFRFRQALKTMSTLERWKFFAMLAEIRCRPGNNQSFQEYLDRRTENDLISRGFKSFCIWSLSLEPAEICCREIFAIIRSLFRYMGPGIPLGGCSGIINALEKVIHAKGNTIIHKKVTEILADDKVYGVVDEDGRECTDTVIVSAIGGKLTSELVKFPPDYQKRIDHMKPSEGIKYSLASQESLIWHSGVLFTPGLDYIGGLNQVTNVDPSLAPPGYHLIMAHQKITSPNFKREREKGLEELETLFKGKYKVLATQIYREKNPVNCAAAGYDLDQKTPIKGLYLVGDCAKGRGGIEVEGIALGVERLRRLVRCCPDK